MEEKKYNNDGYNDNDTIVIDMDIHIMGGYKDERGTSLKLSTYLLGLFANFAEEFSNDSSSSLLYNGRRRNTQLFMTLGTCAVSRLNNTTINGRNTPIGRGLGLNVSTGRVFLAKVDPSVAGPALTLRSARIWAGSGRPSLYIIHDVILPPNHDKLPTGDAKDDEKTVQKN
eukprot:8113094-Ditylum_brightwellii.AAC.1